MTVFIFAVFVMSLLFCIGEAYWERDWPREGAKYLLASTISLVLWLYAIG